MMNAPATRTTCPYCGVGCGVIVRPLPDGTAEIKGDADHPANFGRLCSKGAALGETLSLDGRLLAPIVFGERANWDRAFKLVADRLAETIKSHGPDSVAFYVSGQLLTEDYYVANKLMKGYIGSANIDTNSRLCMASSVAGHRLAFGSDTVPGAYDDIESADLVVLVGSNLAWCHPVLYQRLATARARRGTKVVVIDPRATATCEVADLHLPIAPGSDVALFNGLLRHLAFARRLDVAFVANHTNGFDRALEVATRFDADAVADVTELPGVSLENFYELFATTERVVTIYSQGVNQSSAGTDKVCAIVNCHLATGRIGKPGAGPFSVTGQPNAMGGREVGGLANMLAAHMALEDPRHRKIVQDFWNSPRIADRPGLKAVDLFRAAGDGRVKALWIMGTNPADSMPEADIVRTAILACPFVVVSDICGETDTTALADVLLPSAAWGEKDGTVTNSERRVSRQRRFLPAPGEALPDWRQICEVAKRMGFSDAFDFATPGEIFAEHARLTGVDNRGQRDLDLSAYGDVTEADYGSLAPFQWPQAGEETARETRFFGDGRFYHADGKARFIATPYRAPASALSSHYPLTLNTGRIRDQWHTMTRTAKTPRLMAHIGEPFVEVHPDDASVAGLEAAALAEVESARGRAVLRVVVSERQRRGSLFAPMHWTDQHASKGRIGALVGGAADPVSGQPELKYTPVALRRYPAVWHAVAVSEQPIDASAADYFALAPVKAGFRAELAGLRPPPSWSDFARLALALEPEIEWLAYLDAASEQARFLAFRDDRLVAAFFASRAPVAVARTWIGESLGAKFEPSGRLRLLAGRPAKRHRDRGAIVCACFDVGRNEILEAALQPDGGSVEAVGLSLRAGTNCGSCRPEIRRIVASTVESANARRIVAGRRESAGPE